jgi:hypothetical protein
MNDLDLLAAQAVSRARLLETALHGAGPWYVVFYGADTECRVPAERTVLEGERRISLAAVVEANCRDIYAMEIYCGPVLMTAHDISGSPSPPCRIVLDIAVGDPETVL